MAICTYYNCVNALYLEWRAAINANPILAKQLRVKVEKASAIMALWYAAEACGSSAEQTVQEARLRNLFTGNTCLDSVAPGTGGLLVASGTFTDTDLDAGYVLTIVHNLASVTVNSLTVIDPDDVSQPLTPTIVDLNTVQYNFGASIGAGTFTWIVIAV